MATRGIHPFYHAWFKYMDPLVLAPTVYAAIFDPELILHSFVPASLSAYNPDQGFLFHQLSALFGFVGLIQGGVLRVSDDIKVWRAINAAVLVVDVAMLASLYVSLEQQDRLHLGSLRAGDLGNFFFTAWVTLIRISFLAGVGGSYETTKTKES